MDPFALWLLACLCIVSFFIGFIIFSVCEGDDLFYSVVFFIVAVICFIGIITGSPDTNKYKILSVTDDSGIINKINATIDSSGNIISAKILPPPPVCKNSIIDGKKFLICEVQ